MLAKSLHPKRTSRWRISTFLQLSNYKACVWIDDFRGAWHLLCMALEPPNFAAEGLLRETRANFGSVSGLSGFRTWKSLMGKDTRIGSISCTGPQRALVPSDAPQSGRLPRFPATRSMCWRTTRTTQLCWSESRTSKDQSHFEQAASKPPGEGSSHCLQRTLLSCL